MNKHKLRIVKVGDVLYPSPFITAPNNRGVAQGWHTTVHTGPHVVIKIGKYNGPDYVGGPDKEPNKEIENNTYVHLASIEEVECEEAGENTKAHQIIKVETKHVEIQLRPAVAYAFKANTEEDIVPIAEHELAYTKIVTPEQATEAAVRAGRAGLKVFYAYPAVDGVHVKELEIKADKETLKTLPGLNQSKSTGIPTASPGAKKGITKDKFADVIKNLGGRIIVGGLLDSDEVNGSRDDIKAWKGLMEYAAKLMHTYFVYLGVKNGKLEPRRLVSHEAYKDGGSKTADWVGDKDMRVVDDINAEVPVNNRKESVQASESLSADAVFGE